MTPHQVASNAAGADPGITTTGLGLVYQELLTVVARLHARRQPVSQADVFRQQLLGMLGAAEAETRRRGFSPEQARQAMLAMVAALDEAALSSGNPGLGDWSKRTLQLELFREHIAGETFYNELKKLLSADTNPHNADLLEIYQTCLLLGYRGRYGGRDSDLRALAARLEETIRRVRGPMPSLATENAEAGGPVFAGPDALRKKLLVAAVALAVLAVVLFVTYTVTLNSGVSGLRAAAVLIPLVTQG